MAHTRILKRYDVRYTINKSNDVLDARHARMTRTAAAAAAATVVQQTWVQTLIQAFHANPIAMMTSVAVCLGSVACVILLIAAIPALISLKKTMDATQVLVESLQEELPDAVAALKLSGLELTDAIEEVSGLGSDLTEGLRASVRALVGAESGVREGAKVASEVLGAMTPAARVAAERALQKRATMKYSEGTVADIARATRVASKRVRYALAAAQTAQTAQRALSSSSSSSAAAQGVYQENFLRDE